MSRCETLCQWTLVLHVQHKLSPLPFPVTSSPPLAPYDSLSHPYDPHFWPDDQFADLLLRQLPGAAGLLSISGWPVLVQADGAELGLANAALLLRLGLLLLHGGPQRCCYLLRDRTKIGIDHSVDCGEEGTRWDSGFGRRWAQGMPRKRDQGAGWGRMKVCISTRGKRAAAEHRCVP